MEGVNFDSSSWTERRRVGPHSLNDELAPRKMDGCDLYICAAVNI